MTPADAEATLVQDALAEVAPLVQDETLSDSEKRGLVFDAGLGRVDLPVGLGGIGVRADLQEMVDSELRGLGVSTSYEAHSGGVGIVAPVIARFGTPSQKQRFLRRIFTCEDMWCQLFSEPGAGSDLANLSSRVQRDGTSWVLDGHKVWNTMAHIAQWGLLLARSSDQPRHKGITCFALDMSLPGIEVRPLRQMTGDAEFNEVFFDGVRIPDECRIGEVDGGWAVAMGTLMVERLAVNQLLDHSAPPSRELLELWTHLPAGARSPARRDRLVRHLIEARVCDLTRERSVVQRREGPPGPSGSIVKLLYAEINPRAYDLGLDLLGAAGMLYGDYAQRRPQTWYEVGILEGDMRRAFLRSRANSIEGGSSEIQRNTIAERILGLPREPLR